MKDSNRHYLPTDGEAQSLNKTQEIPQGLWVVATPLGNLADITLRARWALERANILLCEDTRQTLKLLQALGIKRDHKTLHRWDRHTEHGELSERGETLEYWAEKLVEGLNIALVSDAGTPAVSDPGSRIVELAHERGVRVTPIPGASSVTALVSVAGGQGDQFVFKGFFPRREKDQVQALKEAQAGAALCVWFESPQRIVETLAWLAEKEAERRITVAKEMTKIHERVFRGATAVVAKQVAQELQQEGALGEWALALDFSKKSSEVSTGPVSDEAAELGIGLDSVLEFLKKLRIENPPSEIAKLMSQHFGVPKNQIYDAVTKIFKKNY